MAKFNLDEYETVETRLKKFWEANPFGRVLSDVIHQDDRRFIVKAYIYTDRDDQRPVASGLAEEIVGASASPVNKTSALENAETSAIGRALANYIYSGNKRPSREEMEKVERYEKEARKPVKPARVYTELELSDVLTILPIAENSKSVDELRAIWKEYQTKDLLDAPVNNTTLKDTLNRRVASLS